MRSSDKIIEIDLLRLVKVILTKTWLILLSCVLCGIAAFSYSYYFLDPTYQSSALFYVNNSDLKIAGQQLSISTYDISASNQLVDTYAVILKTRNTLNTVINKAHLSYTYEELNEMVSASSVNETEVFEVTVTSKSAEEACVIANAIANVLPDKISSIVTGSGAKIVDYAVVNKEKVAPDTIEYTMVGIVTGAFVACVAIVLVELFDDTIKDDSFLLDTYEDIPVLANIPDLGSDGKSEYYSQYYYYEDRKKRKKKSDSNKKDNKDNNNTVKSILCDQMHFDAKEAYKLLRTNINFTLPDVNCKKIGITSAIRSEGKSTVAINLAYTLAQTGLNVLLIDMDMRLPSVTKKLNMKQGKGLSDILVGDCTFKNVVKPSGKYDNWDILSSGTIPPVPSELIGSSSMKELMAKLSKKYQYIICDLPPINVVTDASVAKEHLDGLILSVRQDYSDKKSLADCMRQLSFIEANILGFVVSNTDDGSHYGKNYSKYYKKYKKYGYYKNYGSCYYKEDSDKKEEKK